MRRAIVAVVLLVIGAALVGIWWSARAAPERAADLLVRAGVDAERADSLVARLNGRAGSTEEQVLVASGTIEGDEVSIVSELGGRIARLDVDEGDEVAAGEVLVELDAGLLQAEIARSNAAVAASEANLANVLAGTHPAQILAAKAAVVQATSEREAARVRVEDARALLGDPQEIRAQIVQAQGEVDLAAAQIEQAQAQVAGAEAQRDRYRGQGSMEEKALFRMFDYQVAAAKAAQEAAEAHRRGAEDTIRMLQTLRDHPLGLASQVHLAEGQLQVADRAVAVAEAKLAELEAGPTPEEVALAEAQVAQARAVAAALQAQVDKMVLRAPISGVVTTRAAHAGEVAMAGATLLTLANLDEVRLTVYIPEDELAQVSLGQQVQVEVDSFPNEPFEGTVSFISREAEFTPKNVQTENDRVNMVFAVRVHLANPDRRLKPGMPADATLGKE